ncbi:MAG: helix-turn-helix domain-containing protein, partial [Peptostreptococcaceae bacterium]
MNNIIRSTADKANATREKIKLKMEEVNLTFTTPSEIQMSTELTLREKNLYAQLLALAQQKGYVYATDEYLCALNGVFSKSSIQKWLKGLRDKGYIFSQLIYNDVTNNIESRKIFLTDKFKS